MAKWPNPFISGKQFQKGQMATLILKLFFISKNTIKAFKTPKHVKLCELLQIFDLNIIKLLQWERFEQNILTKPELENLKT